MDQVKYYAGEMWAFVKKNWVIVAGALGILVLALAGRKRYHHKIEGIRRNTNAAVVKEEVIQEKAFKAAQKQVDEAIKKGNVSRLNVSKARKTQAKVAKLKLREQPEMTEQQLVDFMNEE